VAGPWLEDVLPLHLATVTFPDTHPLRGTTGEVLGFAVRHRRGLVVFDTGIGAGNPLVDRHYQPVRHALEDELARHEHRLDDVTAVVNSHLHFDHCGNNPLFPGVPIYAQAGELEAVRDPWYTVQDWVDFPGVEYRHVDGDAEVEPGMRIVATPGHTRGHQSLVLDSPAGPVVLAGQAVYSRTELDAIIETGSIPPGDAPPEPEQYLASARRLIELEPRRVHFSHDPEIWEPSAATNDA
jgi:glyoxylase-like metal-dependent hydrolase (beta-lactamase superfamily II)